MAVPTNGAEQGVAINVAKNPLKKSLKYKLLFFIRLKLLILCGKFIWNWLNIFIINKKITKVIKIKKYGCWNCIPQEIENLKYCKNKNIKPNSINEKIIPKAVIKKLTLAFFCSDEKTDISFIERMGKTQGITFNIKPANNDIKMK